MSNTEQKQKILLKRTTEVNKPSIPSGASHGELFLNIASGANAHNKISTMQIGTNEPIIWSDDVANEKKFALKTEVEALVKEVEDNELVTATAISTMNASAGFNEDGSSVLDGGVSLSQAIIELQSRTGEIEESDPIFTKSAAAGITSSNITNWNNKLGKTEKAASAKISDSATTTVSAKTSVSATTAVSAKTSVSATTSTKAIQDGNGNVIATTYSTKEELSDYVREHTHSDYDNGTTQVLTNDENEPSFFSVNVLSEGDYSTSDGSLDIKGNSISLDSDSIELKTWIDSDENILTLDKDGLKFNNKEVLTENSDGILMVDNNNIVNKNEVIIGNFEIKNDKPYSYTFEGYYYPYIEDTSLIVAEYNQQGAVLLSSMNSGEYYAYTFIITEAKHEVEVEDEFGGYTGDFEWVDYDAVIGRELYVNAALLDSDYQSESVALLEFVDDKCEINNDIYVDSGQIDESISNGRFIRTAPFSLKRSSKVLLNGSPIMTTQTLLESEIVSSINKKIDDVSASTKTYSIVKVSDGLGANVKEVYKLVDEDNVQSGEVISIYKDSTLKSASLETINGEDYLSLVYITSDGNESKISINVADFLRESEFKDGLKVENGIVSIKIDSESDSFISVNANGIKLTGVESAIDELNTVIESNFDELNERIDSSKLTSTTWSNLNSLKNNSKLIPGTKYRITDYVATSISENTSCNTSCKFDIIVAAISVNELDEVATTISKDGVNEEIYKIWYSLKNDSERFDWADTTNGKGVIYRMIDKYNNDIPYDFRNILFRGRNVRVFTNGSLGTVSINEGEYYNTLCSIASSDGINEGSVLGLFNNTKIESTFNTDGKQILNNILLISYGKKLISNITLDKGCYKNILVNCSNLHFDENCYNNYVVAYAGYYSDEISFGIGCHDNFMNGNCHNIKIGAGCSHNMFGYASNCITMEDKVVGNILGATDTYREKPTFGETSFYDVSLVENEIEESDIIDLMNVLNIDIIAGSSIKYCTFKHQSRCNILGNGSQLVTLGMRSHHNIIGEYSTRIIMGDVTYGNILFANGYTKTTDESGAIKWVAPSSIVSDVVLESRVAYCQVGSKNVSDTPSGNIKIGQKSYNILIPAGSENVVIGTDVWHVNAEKPLKNVEIKEGNAEINLTGENVLIESGVYENNFNTTPTYKEVTTLNNSTHILPKNDSISCGANTKVNGKYCYAFGDCASNSNYSFSSGIGTAYGNGSFSTGGFYSRNFQTITIDNVSYELSSDEKYTIATCDYTHNGDNGHVNKYPCIGNGLNGCIGYITEITQKATTKGGAGVFKFYIPTTSLTNGIPSEEKFIIKNGTHYISNATIGASSVSFGIINSSKGLASGTIGFGLQANNAYEFACGKYNLSSNNTVFSVGYGDDNENRRNIFEVKTNNTAYINGTKVSVDGHKHSASNITSGTFAASRIPTGITVSESISASTADYALKVKDGAYFKGIVNEYPWLSDKTYNIGDFVIYKSNSDLGTSSDGSFGSATSDDSFGDTSTVYILAEEGWEEIGSSMSQEIYAFKEDIEKTYLVGIKNGDEDFTIDTLNYSSKIYASNGNLYAESDKTLKTHIGNVNGDPELIRQIPKVYYHWNDDETKETQMGTYAQDLEKVYPELVATDKDGVKAVAYDKLSVIALAGIDKLYEMVQQLQAKNEELEKRIKELENK